MRVFPYAEALLQVMWCSVWLVPNNSFHVEGATGLKVWSARQLVVCSCRLFPRSSLASAELLPGGCLVAFCCSLRSTGADTAGVAWKASRGFTGACVPQTQSNPHVLKGSVIPIHNSGPPPRVSRPGRLFSPSEPQQGYHFAVTTTISTPVGLSLPVVYIFDTKPR